MALKICQIGKHVQRLVTKLKILHSLDHPILFKFRQLVVNIVIKDYNWYFELLQLAIAMEALQSLNTKFSVKSCCFDRIYCIAFAK